MKRVHQEHEPIVGAHLIMLPCVCVWSERFGVFGRLIPFHQTFLIVSSFFFYSGIVLSKLP